MSILRTMAVASAVAVSAYINPSRGSAQSPSYATHGDPSLASLIGEALEGNPRVRAAFLEFRAAESRAEQAGTLPDPALSLTQHVLGPQTRVGPQFSNVSVTQSLPWFGTVSDRRAVSAAASAMQSESYHVERAEIVRQVKLAYYDLAYIDEALRITGEEEQLLLHYEALARARYSQGFGQQQEVVKLQAEVTRVLNRRHELLGQRTDFEAALNVLANRPVNAPVAPVKLGERPEVSLDDERLRATGLGERPEVRAARLRIERDDHGASLARRRYRPGLTIGVAWGNVLGRRDDPGRADPPPDNGRDTWSLTLGANIPVFRGSYEAGVREAAARLSAAEEAYREAANGVSLAVRSTAFRITTIEGQLALFERALLPQAEQALRATEEAYSGGVAGVLELLDSEEMLLDVRLGLARLQADYMKALAEMERAIGSAFPEEEGS
ncbi:MAG: TolC family protein [Gemmatimonadetes bacterium]|nr:TolC family protein [Gemmatimonadota bacterium]MYH53038.1 TolC family protein [Gemmatimonadota bacterium]MYK66783.1 TolC family protein [Gemmatimonadota bacterium]